jgi:Ca2+-binding RTX toxin-like protein
MTGRSLFAAALFVALLVPPGAPAATVALAPDNGLTLTVVDTQNVPDDLRISRLTDGKTFAVSGETAQAGTGCHQDATTVLCPTSNGLANIAIQVAGGDDHVFIDPSAYSENYVELIGGSGNDTLEGEGQIEGGTGDDVLRLTGASPDIDVLDGGPGNDQIQASDTPATLIGGPGTDDLRGGAGNDALIDVGDRGGHDQLHCGGGKNLLERDADDRLVGCNDRRVDVLAQLRHKWFVKDGFTLPLKLVLSRLPALGQAHTEIASPIVSCRGAACGHAKFGGKDTFSGGILRTRYKIYAGGFRMPGRSGRAVKTGATIRVETTIFLGGYTFVKVLEFHARDGAIPRVRKVCKTGRPGSAPRRVSCA